VDVADQARDLAIALPPRKDEEGRQVGDQEHVALFHADEPLDGRPVEQDVARQRLGELRRRDFDVLVDAEDVGELQPDETDVVPLGDLEEILGGHTTQVTEQGAGGGGHDWEDGEGRFAVRGGSHRVVESAHPATRTQCTVDPIPEERH